jgi:hypothetical protein
MLGPRVARRGIHSTAALTAQPSLRSLDARHVAHLHRYGPDVALVFALRLQFARPQSLAPHPCWEYRFRPSCPFDDKAFSSPRRRCELAAGAFRGDHRPRSARFGLSSDDVSGEPNRWEAYCGNPTITPLVRESDARDTQINPSERRDTPRSVAEIINRLNSPLAKELRMITLLRHSNDLGKCSSTDLDVLLEEC